MSAMYPELSKDDNRKKLLQDLDYGGFYGYANARQMPLDWPSTLEFEDAVLRDVMNRTVSIAYREADEAHSAALKKFQDAACEAYRIADYVWEKVPAEHLPAEYAAKMNKVYDMLANLGIEVEG